MTASPAAKPRRDNVDLFEIPPFPTSPKPYAKARWQWIWQVALDSDLTYFQRLVGIRISSYHNPELGYSYPTYGQITADLGAESEDGAQRAVKALVRKGHLYVIYGRGNGISNRYFLILKGHVRDETSAGSSS